MKTFFFLSLMAISFLANAQDRERYDLLTFWEDNNNGGNGGNGYSVQITQNNGYETMSNGIIRFSGKLKFNYATIQGQSKSITCGYYVFYDKANKSSSATLYDIPEAPNVNVIFPTTFCSSTNIEIGALEVNFYSIPFTVKETNKISGITVTYSYNFKANFYIQNSIIK